MHLSLPYIIHIRLMALRDQESGADAPVSDVHKEAKEKTVWRNQKIENDKNECSFT